MTSSSLDIQKDVDVIDILYHGQNFSRKYLLTAFLASEVFGSCLDYYMLTFVLDAQGLSQGGSARWIAGKLKKHKNLYFSSTTFTTVFKICLYARCFDSSVCPHKIFWQHFANSSKLLKNHFVNELDLTSIKFAAIKWFFKSLEELAKCCQKILCGHTDESKHLAYRHILKTVVKVVEEKFNFLCFS